MTYILLMIIVALQVVAVEMLRTRKPVYPADLGVSRAVPEPQHTPVDDGRIRSAVLGAFKSVGLPGESFHDDFNIQHTGKIQDVLHHASHTLGIDHRLRTVGDLIAYLTSQV